MVPLAPYHPDGRSADVMVGGSRRWVPGATIDYGVNNSTCM